MADATRFRLELPAGKAGPNAAKALSVALGVDMASAARLLAALPRLVAVTGTAGAGRERVITTLGREAIAAIPVESARGQPCREHRRLLAEEVCPVCGERRACAVCLSGESESRCAVCRGKARFWTRFRNARIAVLLVILGAIFWTTYVVQWRLHNWSRPLRVAIYPLAVETTPEVESWTAQLGPSDFAAVSAFLDREGKRWGVPHEHLSDLVVSPSFHDVSPPEPPTDGKTLSIAEWSLKLRLWAFEVKRRHHLPGADAEIFVLYEKGGEKSLDRSLAVEKMRVGIVHTFAGAANAGWTDVAIAHELLHTLGASDKYQANGMPVFPDGFAEPMKAPLLPQRACEIMAGQIAVTDHSFYQATSLAECLVGEKTAREIGWRRQDASATSPSRP